MSSAGKKSRVNLTLNISQDQGFVRIDVDEMLKNIDSGSLLVSVSWVFKCSRKLPKLDISSLPFEKPSDRGYGPIADIELAFFVV
jgi:hypothetical protein